MKTPSFDYEQQYWSQDITTIAGLDEAGMGALAGPVVAGAVVFSSSAHEKIIEQQKKIPIRDSKLLSEAQRERAALFIKEVASFWAIGTASVYEIDAINIRAASHLAMQRAIAALAVSPDILIVDGTPTRLSATIPTTAIVKGDQLSYSIAAASILAKVSRDAIMKALHESFPVYG